MDIFHVRICCKFVMCLKRQKEKEKETGVGPFFNKNSYRAELTQLQARGVPIKARKVLVHLRVPHT